MACQQLHRLVGNKASSCSALGSATRPCSVRQRKNQTGIPRVHSSRASLRTRNWPASSSPKLSPTEPPLASTFLGNRLRHHSPSGTPQSLGHPAKGRRERRLPQTKAFLFELIAIFSFAATATALLAIPITIATTAVAGTVALVTGVLFTFAIPLLPIALATSILGPALPFIWTIVDRFLFLAVALNFAVGVIGLANTKNSDLQLVIPQEYRKAVPKRIKKLLQREGVQLIPSDFMEPYGKSAYSCKSPFKAPPSSTYRMAAEPTSRMAAEVGGSVPSQAKGFSFWLLPTVLSCIPGVHGASWLAAFSEWPSYAFPRWDFRAGLLRNALVYGGTGLLGFMFGYPFGAPVVAVTAAKAGCWGMFFCKGATVVAAAAPSAANGSFWLSLVLGATHLQLDRLWLKRLAPPAAVQPKKKGGEDVVAAGPPSEEVEAAERRRRDLEEFDARLRYKATGGELDRNAREWTMTEVAMWLEDNGFAEYISSFKDHDIDGGVLVQLTDYELRTELGVERLGQRKRMLLLIQELGR